jgi:DNA-3-methyladenine glycosylase I
MERLDRWTEVRHEATSAVTRWQHLARGDGGACEKAGVSEVSRAMKNRCPWAEAEVNHEYHDNEWGVPVHDDRLLFEMLILEGAQAGLSWTTILRKRASYRKAFNNFDAKRIARYDDEKVAALLADPGIVRNRLKVRAAISNAQAFLDVQMEFGGFNAYIWGFVGGQPVQHNLKAMAEIPAHTEDSDAMSKALLKRGFKFVGSTICYAYMQAVGMVNDHLVTCPRHRACAKMK